MDFGQAEAFARIVAAFGVPIWAASVIWILWQIYKVLSGAIEALRARDTELEKLVNQHIASTDKRIDLLKQIVDRHDNNIEAMWSRLDGRAEHFRQNERA